MQHNKTKLLILFALVFGSLLCIRLSYAAWSEPTVTPPDGNAAAPLTISSAAQNKTGSLSISSVTAYTAPGAYAPIYYDSNNTSYYIQPSNTGTSAVFAGSVGIGVTNPTRNVDVFEPTDSTVVLRLSGNRSGTNGHADRIELVAPASPAAANKKSFELINMNPAIAGGENYLDFRSINDDLSNSIDNILVINHSGSVGIGTTSPGGILDIGGSGYVTISGYTNGGTTGMMPSGINHGTIVGPSGKSIAIALRDDQPTTDRVSIIVDPDGTGGPNTEALVVRGDGNVGIGTTSPQALLTLQKAESNTAGSGGGLGYQASNGGIWHTQRMNTSHTLVWDDYNGSSWVTGLTQTNSGNVGIGTTNPLAKLHIAGTGQTVGRFTAYSSTYSDYQGEPAFDFQKSHSDSLGTVAVTQDGEDLGSFYFDGVKNSVTPAFRTAAYIRVFQNGASSASDVPADFAFFTSDGTTSAQERLRITKSGNVGIGTTSPDQKLTVTGTIHSTTGGIEFPDGTTQTTAAGGSSYVSGGHYGYYAYDVCGCSNIYIAPMTTSHTCPAGFTYETTGSAPGSYTCGPCGQYVYWATCVKN